MKLVVELPGAEISDVMPLPDDPAAFARGVLGVIAAVHELETEHGWPLLRFDGDGELLFLYRFLEYGASARVRAPRERWDELTAAARRGTIAWEGNLLTLATIWDGLPSR
jgi:hypothetical protein